MIRSVLTPPTKSRPRHSSASTAGGNANGPALRGRAPRGPTILTRCSVSARVMVHRSRARKQATYNLFCRLIAKSTDVTRYEPSCPLIELRARLTVAQNAMNLLGEVGGAPAVERRTGLNHIEHHIL